MSTDLHSPQTPTSAVVSNGGVNSPQSRRRSLSSPWASVVRGDLEQISSPTAAAAPTSPPTEQASTLGNSLIDSSGSEAQPESSDVNGDGNAGRPRRPAWNTPLNGVVNAGGSVMGGAVAWPALSESTRPVPRLSTDSSRPVSDGSTSSSKAPIISQPPQRHTNSHVNSTANSTTPTRPRSRNRGGGGGGGGGGSSGNGPPQNTFIRPSASPPPFPIYELPYGMVPTMIETPVRGSRPVGGPGGSQSNTGNDHSSQRNTSRRGNYGPRPRGDGPYHNNHGGRRDQDRREVHLPQYMPPPIGFLPPPLPHGAGPFMIPPPMRGFTGQMGFDMASPFMYVPTMSPESFRPMPIVPPVPPMPFPLANENTLTNMIVKQIDYYFSDENLVKDNYLRSNIDDHGWVPISLIASFRRVQLLTSDVSVILEALKNSTIVEVQDDKVRRRNDWHRWLPSSARLNNDAGPSSAPENVVATSLQSISLNDPPMTNANGNMGNMDAREGHTEELTGQSRSENGDDTAEVGRWVIV